MKGLGAETHRAPKSPPAGSCGAKPSLGDQPRDAAVRIGQLPPVHAVGLLKAAEVKISPDPSQADGSQGIGLGRVELQPIDEGLNDDDARHSLPVFEVAEVSEVDAAA